MNRSVITDSALYIGCHACKAACSETRHQHGLQSMPRLRMMLNERKSTPQLCHRCEDAPCAVVYPADAITRVDGTVQLNESLCVNCKLCGIACPLGATEFSGSRLLDIPVNANTPKVSPAPPAPARASTLLDWVLGIHTIVVRCDPCSFNGQGPACVRICPTKALRLVDNTDITRVSKRKRKLTFNMDSGNLTLSQQAQSGEAK